MTTQPPAGTHAAKLGASNNPTNRLRVLIVDRTLSQDYPTQTPLAGRDIAVVATVEAGMEKINAWSAEGHAPDIISIPSTLGPVAPNRGHFDLDKVAESMAMLAKTIPEGATLPKLFVHGHYNASNAHEAQTLSGFLHEHRVYADIHVCNVNEVANFLNRQKSLTDGLSDHPATTTNFTAAINAAATAKGISLDRRISAAR